MIVSSGDGATVGVGIGVALVVEEVGLGVGDGAAVGVGVGVALLVEVGAATLLAISFHLSRFEISVHL